MSEKIKVSIVGATGYTGLELLRLLIAHPNVEIKHLLTKNHSGEKVSDLYPHLKNCCEMIFEPLELIESAATESDVVFLALPHLQSSLTVPKILGKTKIIDLSGDFRIKDVGQFEKYYGAKHLFQDGIPEFTYGLSESKSNLLSGSQNVANPGCFSIVCQLALLPLKDKIKSVEIFAITGSSGAGKQLSDGTHHPLRNHNIKSYKVGIHQHIPEILQTLNMREDQIIFTPAIGPFTRGIYLNAFVDVENFEGQDFQAQYEDFFSNSPFVRVKNEVQLSEVIASNFCDLSLCIVNGKLVINAAIDNLVKGAAGNAIQNMNIICGLDETLGLSNFTPLFP